MSTCFKSILPQIKLVLSQLELVRYDRGDGAASGVQSEMINPPMRLLAYSRVFSSVSPPHIAVASCSCSSLLNRESMLHSHKFTKLGTPHSEANRHNELIMAILERVRQTRVRRHAQRQIPFTCIKRGDPLEAEGNCTQETRVFCTQGQVPHRTHRTNEYPVMAM